MEEDDNKYVITYYQTIEDIPVLDLYFKFTVTSGGVKQLEIINGFVEINKDASSKITPIDEVLFKSMDNMLEDNFKSIDSITLAYKKVGDKGITLGQRLVPVYMIKCNDKVIYVNARSNKIIKNK